MGQKQHKKTEEFNEHYNRLADIYGDPVETLFDLQGDPLVPHLVRLQAAKELANFKYAKKRAIEVKDTRQASIKLDKDDEGIL